MTVREREKNIKKRQKNNYDVRRGVKTLQHLEHGDKVWIPDRKESGTIEKKLNMPRSYIVETPTGTVRRNRRHLIEIPTKSSHGKQQETTQPTADAERSENNTGYYTRSGRFSVPPDRLEIRH